MYRIFLALLLLATPAAAGEYEDVSRELLGWIGEHSDYNVDVPLPPIMEVTQDDLTIMFYGRLPNENESFLQIHAIYLDDPPAIWVEEGFDLSTGVHRHTLLHELVHHLQNLSDRHFACVGEKEGDAYELSDKYAVEVLQDESLKADPLMLLLISQCHFRR